MAEAHTVQASQWDSVLHFRTAGSRMVHHTLSHGPTATTLEEMDLPIGAAALTTVLPQALTNLQFSSYVYEQTEKDRQNEAGRRCGFRRRRCY